MLLQSLQAKGKAEYQVILDPFKRIQAAFIPGEVILPVQPSVGTPDRGVPVRAGYADIRDEELPTGKSARAFLADVKEPDVQGTSSRCRIWLDSIVELELALGFRVAIQPEEGEGRSARGSGDRSQGHGGSTCELRTPNPADIKLASEISYASEIYEFLLFSISKDVQTDDYASLSAGDRNSSLRGS
jgi:hypothetical protein